LVSDDRIDLRQATSTATVTASGIAPVDVADGS
jgi:hypothetical protein